MTRTTRIAALSFLAVAAAVAGVTAARAGEGDDAPRGRRGDGLSRMERRLGRGLLRRRAMFREVRRENRQERREERIARVMEMPEDRAREALAASERAATLREETRARAAAILAKAWRESAGATDERRAEIRAGAREALKSLRAEAAPKFAEVGRPLVESMAPDRREKAEAGAKEKGREFDPERVATRLGRRLGGPMVRAVLRERLGEAR